MLAVKSMDVRENFKSLCDKVFKGETVIISRPKNENIVMMSESEYNEIIKAKRNEEYLAMLDKSMAEAEAGGFPCLSVPYCSFPYACFPTFICLILQLFLSHPYLFQTSGKLLGYLIKQISFAALASGFPFLFSSLFRILDLFF